jgi:hypothetical protein
VTELERLSVIYQERIVAVEGRLTRHAEDWRARLDQQEMLTSRLGVSLEELRSGVDRNWRAGSTVERSVSQWGDWSRHVERRFEDLEFGLRQLREQPRPTDSAAFWGPEPRSPRLELDTPSPTPTHRLGDTP